MTTVRIEDESAAKMAEILTGIRQGKSDVPQIVALIDPLIDRLNTPPVVLTADELVKIRPFMVRYLEFLKRSGPEPDTGLIPVAGRMQNAGRINTMERLVSELPDLPSAPGKKLAS